MEGKILHFPKVNKEDLIRKRCFAFTVDLMFIIMINRAIMFTYMNFIRTFFLHIPYHAQSNLVEGLPQIHLTTLLAVFFGYFTISYYMGEGQTPGKLLFGLRIYSKRKNSIKLNLQESILRTMGYFLCYITGFVFFLIPFLRRDQKGIPDWFSRTEVILKSSYVPTREVIIEVEEDSNQLELFGEDRNIAA